MEDKDEQQLEGQHKDQARIKCADGVLRPKAFCEAEIDEIYD